MDQGRFELRNKEEHSSEQGKYGDYKASPKDASWVCPECETINTENTCILCGYKKEKLNTIPAKEPEPESGSKTRKKKPVWIAAAAAILAVVALAGFFATRLGNETASLEINTSETSASMQETALARDEPTASSTDVPEVLEENLLMADPNLATGNSYTENYQHGKHMYPIWI